MSSILNFISSINAFHAGIIFFMFMISMSLSELCKYKKQRVLREWRMHIGRKCSAFSFPYCEFCGKCQDCSFFEDEQDSLEKHL